MLTKSCSRLHHNAALGKVEDGVVLMAVRVVVLRGNALALVPADDFKAFVSQAALNEMTVGAVGFVVVKSP